MKVCNINLQKNQGMIFRFHVSWLGLSTFICAMFMAISNTIRETSTSTTVFFLGGRSASGLFGPGGFDSGTGERNFGYLDSLSSQWILLVLVIDG